MGDVNEKEETGQELPDGLEDKQQNDELRQVEEHDYPEPMEENKDPNKKSNSDSLPMEEDEASPCSNGNLIPEAETDPASDDENVELQCDQEKDQASPPSSPLHEDQASVKPDTESTLDVKPEEHQELAESKTGRENESTISVIHTQVAEAAIKDSITDASDLPEGHAQGDGGTVCVSVTHIEEPATPHYGSSDIKAEIENGEELNKGLHASVTPAPEDNGNSNAKHSFLCYDDHMYYEGSESGTEEDQLEFMKELENFFKEMSMEFKPPKFYGEGLNCLKLWRAVNKLGGYEKVTSCKLWRQVGESFKPPKTCTTVSWTFRIFYEKALLDYERHKTRGGELIVPIASHIEPIVVENQGSGRARRDAAARAMQGWHSHRLVGNGEVSNPIIKDKNSITLQKREKQLKSVGLIKRKKPPHLENPVKAARTKIFKPQVDTAVVDIGAPADWVKINVQKTKDCYEIYALVPGLLREEVRVQSDPVGRLVISGEPEQPDNPWGVTPFKKVVSLPSRIDPHQTSAVVTLHGQLFIRAPLEHSDM